MGRYIVTSQELESAITSFRDLGVELNSDWLGGLEILNDGPLTVDDVYLSLVASDLRQSVSSARLLPLASDELRRRSRLPHASFLFQITSAIDISIPDALRPKLDGPSHKRMLKLVLDCGDIRMHAVELETSPQIPDQPVAGMKVIICGGPLVYQDLVMLKAENIKVVGGEVDQLVALQKCETEYRLKERDPLQLRPSYCPLNEVQNRF